MLHIKMILSNDDRVAAKAVRKFSEEQAGRLFG